MDTSSVRWVFPRNFLETHLAWTSIVIMILYILCSRDGKICCYGDALSLLAFVPCFLLFVFLFAFLSLLIFFSLRPGMFIFLVSLRLCSSHMLLSASTYFVVRVLSACVICTLPHLGILSFFHSFSLFFFFSSYFSGGVFFVVLSYPGYASTWFASYLDYLAFGFSLSHCLWPQNLYLSRMKNQEGHWGYCWFRWVERTL